MVTVAPKPSLPSQAGRERREFRRIQIKQFCRTLVQGQEYSCEVIDVSVGGAALKTEATPEMGESVLLYFDDMGRVRGQVVRVFEDGFAVSFGTAQIKRDRVVQRLDLLVQNGRTQSLPHERMLLELLDAGDGIALSKVRPDSILKRTLDECLAAGWIESVDESGTQRIRITDRGRLLGPLAR
jgi:PilZ domain